MMKLREVSNRIWLTFDLWTSIATNNNISLATHYVDSDWKFQKKLLSFSYMRPYNGVELSEIVQY